MMKELQDTAAKVEELAAEEIEEVTGGVNTTNVWPADGDNGTNGLPAGGTVGDSDTARYRF